MKSVHTLYRGQSQGARGGGFEKNHPHSAAAVLRLLSPHSSCVVVVIMEQENFLALKILLTHTSTSFTHKTGSFSIETGCMFYSDQGIVPLQDGWVLPEK